MRGQSEPDPNLKVRTALDRVSRRNWREVRRLWTGGRSLPAPHDRESVRTVDSVRGWAQPHLDRAFERGKKLFGRNDLKTVEAVEELGRLANDRENLKQAVALYQEVTDVRRRIL